MARSSATLSALLAGYSTQTDRYDELLGAGGEPRAPWAAFLEGIAGRDGRLIGDTLSLTERQIREHGITYNVYDDAKGAERPWEVDPLPLMLAGDEWQRIEAGIVQRAELLNRVLADIYGPQELLRSGEIPPPVVFGHGNFLSPAQGIKPAGGAHLFQYAADLARSPDGSWWVVADRTQAPSGAGYALENRLVVSRVFPQMFRELQVQHLASFFQAFREAILQWAPRDDGLPLIALLTPGPYNETYFEHALLARYLGFTLVEGNDLTVRDDRVWLKTIDGLQRVHAIVRRQDDDYCDPLELRSDSALGVAGLTDVARRGNVMLANALGSGILESGALLGYLPKLARRLLGEELKLPSVATWWLGEPAALDDAWSHLEHLVVKPLERTPKERPLFAADLSANELKRLRARIAERPHHYVAQEWVHVSQAPVLERGDSESFAARTVGLRVFAVATPSGWRVMPGGLTRVANDSDSRIIAMQRGGRSKDTWVISDAPVNASFSLLTKTVTASDLAHSKAALSSRGAENLFWFGRYGERCDITLRLLRVALAEAVDDAADPMGGISPAWVLAEELGLIDDAEDDAPAALLEAATQPHKALHLRLGQLSRVAFNLRDKMSADHWRTLNGLMRDPVFRRATPLRQALPWLDRAITSTMTLSGFVLDGMTRGVGWRFLSMGRRIERLGAMCSALQVATTEGHTHALGWLLDLADSTVSYRARFLVAPEWLPVLDMVVRDDTNPRSIAFQVKGLADYLVKIEATHGAFASELLAPGQFALRALTAADLQPESPVLAAVLEQLKRAAHAISDELSMKCFSHAIPRSLFETSN